MMKLKDLTPDSRNANKGAARGQKMIVSSLQEDGFGRSGLLDKNGKIIAGNKTTEASAEVFGVDAEPIIIETDGTKPVYVKRTDLDLDTDIAARRLAYRDNLASRFSFELDPDVVMADIEAGFDFEALDISLPDLQGLGVDVNANGAGRDVEPGPVTETEAEKYQKKWNVQPGDVWQLGNHIAACLDSLDKDNILKYADDITMIFADPPYGILIFAATGYVGGGEVYDIPFGGVKNRKGYVGGAQDIRTEPGLITSKNGLKKKRLGTAQGAKPFGSAPVRGTDGASNVVEVGKYYPVIGDETTETAKKAAGIYLELLPEACHIWWGGNYYTDILPPSAGWIIWDKDNTGHFADCEMAWTNQQRAARIFKHRWNGMLKASEQGQRRVHPTQKPIALARYCFHEYGQPGDVVFDPFLGSGISILAADDRRVIGFELEPVYIAVLLERWHTLTGKMPELIDTQITQL